MVLVRVSDVAVYHKGFLEGFTHRPRSSSFLGLLYRVLNMNPERNYYGAYG